jgi:hypothetical protein
MRTLAVTAGLLITVCCAHAEFVGFDVGNGVGLTGGIVRVNFMANKSRTISLGPRFSVRLMEVQLTLANGNVKRQTMLFAGTHVLRVPLSIELTEALGPLCLLALLIGTIMMILSSRLRLAEPGAAPSGGPAAAPLGDSAVASGPPSVS